MILACFMVMQYLNYFSAIHSLIILGVIIQFVYILLPKVSFCNFMLPALFHLSPFLGQRGVEKPVIVSKSQFRRHSNHLLDFKKNTIFKSTLALTWLWPEPATLHVKIKMRFWNFPFIHRELWPWLQTSVNSKHLIDSIYKDVCGFVNLNWKMVYFFFELTYRTKRWNANKSYIEAFYGFLWIILAGFLVKKSKISKCSRPAIGLWIDLENF